MEKLADTLHRSYISSADGLKPYITWRYPYRKLCKGQFRLLELFPRSYKHPLEIDELIPGLRISVPGIHGKLVDADLNNPTTYDCLSYTWGTTFRGCFIFLGDRAVEIGDNLNRALICLQHADKSRLVWVDFICINQDDLEGRKNQVEIMYSIYNLATEVIVDLGPEADDSEQLPELFRTIASISSETLQFTSDEFLIPNYTGCSVTLPSEGDTPWDAFRSFLRRPWFTRVWVVQEAIAAKELKIMCGYWMMEGDGVLDIVNRSITLGLPMLPTFSEEVPVWENALAIGMRQILLLTDLGILKENKFESTKSQFDGPRSLLDILARSRHCRSSDPRDRVFAFLNLCQERDESVFRPDYAETVTEIFMRITKYCISAGYGAKLLCEAFLSESSLGLPSWVPDWSLNTLPFLDIAPHNIWTSKIFDAGGGLCDAQLSNGMNELKITGRIIGHIAEVGKAHQFCPSPPSLVEKWAKSRSVTSDQGRVQVQEHNMLDSGSVEPSAGQAAEGRIDLPVLSDYLSELSSYINLSPAYEEDDKPDIIWRTMVCDQDMQGCRAPSKYQHYWQSYIKFAQYKFFPGKWDARVSEVKEEIRSLNHLKDSEKIDLFWQRVETELREANTFRATAHRLCFRLRVAVTSTGLVGMVPQRAEACDIVAVLRGVPVPMVLRKVEGVEDKFVLVGQAYFHGFMDGEAFQSEHCEEKIVHLV